MSTRQFREAFIVITLFLLCLAIVWFVACTEISQIVEPTSVDVDISIPNGGAAVGTGVDPGHADEPVKLVLDPPTVNVVVGTPVVVKVIALNQAGQEIPSVDLTVSVADPTVAAVKDIDGRFISFETKAIGSTTAIITAAGAQTSLVITVAGN